MSVFFVQALLINFTKSLKNYIIRINNKQLFKSIEKMDGMAVGLARFIQGNPKMYFAGIGETENDMFKFLLCESIKHTQALLDTIQQYEDKTGISVIHKY